MKTSRFMEEQIAFSLKQAELGTKVDEICRRMGISDETFYIYGLTWSAQGKQNWAV